MLKNKSDQVIFLKNTLCTTFLTALMTISSGCGQGRFFKGDLPEIQQNVLGGRSVDPASLTGRKIIYLALGVERQMTESGFLLNMTDQCTAVAIREDVILTAGHCVAKFTTESIYAVLGGDPWISEYAEKNWFGIEKVVVHPEYISNEKEAVNRNDIAVLKLSRPLPKDYVTGLATSELLSLLSEKIKIIEIGYGFHFLEKGKNTEDIEQTLNYTAKELPKTAFTLAKLEVDQKNGVGFCLGDSGGPALVLDPTTYQFKVIGVASYIKSRSDDRELVEKNMELPCRGIGVYTNVLIYSNWISTTISGL